MIAIALRYGDNFAPPEGTIAAHTEIINELGYVWYGKLGLPVSDGVISRIMDQENPQILLIHSGASERYWASVAEIKKQRPSKAEYPEYYAPKIEAFKTWFKVIDIKKAEKNVLSKCIVESSGASLSSVSRHCMSPYFIINYEDEL